MADDLHTLRQQVHGLIDSCKAVVTGRKTAQLPTIDGTTMQVAEAVVAEVKAKYPNDKVIAAITLGPPYSWTGVLTAMETISRTLPMPQGRIQPRVERYTSR